MAGPALTDVPDRFDVVFSLNDGTTYGFLLSDALESSLPFRTHKAVYGYSPTFLERQNLSQSYGDNFQDFFLTGSQTDFSLGEQQKFFRVNDQNSQRRYWNGQNVNPVQVPGDVTLTHVLSTLSSSVGTIATTSTISSAKTSTADWFTADNTNVYSISVSGGTITATSRGAHGAGTVTALTTDQQNIYVGGGTALIKSNANPSGVFTFSTFSSTAGLTSLAFLNNILYGYQQSTDSLISFSSAGAATTQFQWKDADGTVLTNATVTLVPYGGSLFILRGAGQKYELWKYDGSGCLLQAAFPSDFNAQSIDVAQGIVYVSGNTFVKSNTYLPQVYYYINGSLGKLWESQNALPDGNAASDFPLCAFGNGVVFKDCSNNNIYQFDLSLGSTYCIANYNSTSPSVLVSSNLHSAFMLLYNGTIVVYGGASNYNSTGFVETSQYDFDNTLTKFFRGIKIDADLPANTSIDIAYQLDGTGGSYTNLKTGASSGVEYNFPSTTTGHSLSIKATLNSATGSATPTLKRVYVRAAPMLQQFRYREFIFDLSGGYRETRGKTSYRCRDGTPYPYDGFTAAQNLTTVATQVVPFTVADRFGQFTAIADLQQNSAGYDGFAIYEERPGVFIARINLREV